MPKQYEAIRDRFIAEGMGEAEAKTRAAKIYNAQHPNKPVTGSHKSRSEKRRMAKSSSHNSKESGRGIRDLY